MDKNFYIVILIIAFFTMLFRIIPIYININEDNKYVNTFFNLLPISIITVLSMPDIFTSLGKDYKDIVICLVAILFVMYLTYKKKSLGFITVFSVLLIIILRGIYFGNF